ncbi:hypothetical protein BN1708_018844, partial [Verticillium longisporum]
TGEGEGSRRRGDSRPGRRGAGVGPGRGRILARAKRLHGQAVRVSKRTRQYQLQVRP